MNKESEPKSSNRLRNLLIFAVLIVIFGCIGISALGNSIADTRDEIENSLSAGSSSSSSGGSSSNSSSDRESAASLTFTPIQHTGRGDDIVTIDKPDVPAIVIISHTGSSNFILQNYGQDGESIDLLVNEIGNYSGIRPIDFALGEHTRRFEVQADGSWSIEVAPLIDARKVTVPRSSLTGRGDSVLLLTGDSPDTATISHTGDSNFMVMGYGDRRDLLVNEIGNYSGTVMLSRDTLVLEIVADGPWELSITER